ncbi:MAG: DUF748 domain-containing protein [Syntrophothermus sp.]
MNKLLHITGKIGKTTLITISILVIILVAVRIALPYIVKNAVNKKLNEVEGYRGSVDDIDIHLYRGAFSIKGIVIRKVTGNIPTPFFSADELESSIQWSELFHGAIVGEVHVFHPVINFVQGPTPEQSQTKVDKSWQQVLKDLIPLRINQFTINNGEVHFRNFQSDPKVNVYIQRINLEAQNLTNSRKISESMSATLDASGLALKSGEFKVHARIDPYEKKPTFNMNFQLQQLSLVSLNDFLRAYGKFDVHKGTFSMYSEVAASKGRFEGYVKPLLKDVEVFNWKEDTKKPILKAAWQAIVGLIKDIFENAPKDQVATKAPFSGSFDNPEVGVWETIWQLIKNAFIKALMPGLDHSINKDLKNKK